MKIKSMMICVAMGVGGTLLYQQMRNGNVSKCIKDIENFAKKTYNSMYDEMEDMM